jgi:predicted SAM-dependent methyltransferase
MAAAEKTVDPIKYDLACGQNVREGFIGVDIADLPGVHSVDLRRSWPWNDGTVDELHCSHFIEHLDGSEQIHLMNEAHRVLKVGGKLTIITPWWNSVRYHQDPTHKKAFTDNTAAYFNRAWREANKLTHYPITADFDFTIHYSLSDPRWMTAGEAARMFAIRYYANVIDDLTIVFIKRA